MRTISIDLGLALQYAQAEIDRLLSGSSPPSPSSEILAHIRERAQIPQEALTHTELRRYVLRVAFRRIRAS